MKTKLILYPKAAEISYKVALLKFVYLIEKNINNILIPIVRNMPNTFNNDSLYSINYDDFLDEIDIALEEIRVLTLPYRDLLIKSLPKRFNDLAKFTTKQVVQSLKDVISVEYGDKSKKIERFLDFGSTSAVLNPQAFDITTNIFNNSLRPNLKELVKSSTITNSRLIKSIHENALDSVAMIIQEGYNSGASVSNLTKKIKNNFGVQEWRAQLIARDQIGKLHSDIVRDEHLNIGITEYEWFTSNDVRVRKSHKKMNRKICSWYDPTIYKNSINDKKWKKRSSIGGVELHPGQDYQCRCNEYGIIDSFDK